MFRIVFYVSESGRAPVREFLTEIADQRAKAQLLRAIHRLGEEGLLPEPFSRAITGSRRLRKLRVTSGGNAYRVFYSIASGGRIILLHAFMKKTQKTPRREIQTAEARLRSFPEGDR
jgi:phage-related protein